MKIVNIDELMSRCGYGTGETNVNGGYGCNHPEQEDYEEVWKDEDGYTHRVFEGDENKPKVRQGKCLASTCPLGTLCQLEDVKKYDPDWYRELQELSKDEEEMENNVEASDSVVINDETYNKLFT